ncbi:MAG: TonB-dependent receptor [Flavobacteriales bacterium]|nr:TonB-dependent receptor [Flavobacteriales bacterium]
MKIFKLTIFLSFFYIFAFAQEVSIHGKIVDKNNRGIDGVAVQVGGFGSVSNNDGTYSIKVKDRKDYTVAFSHIRYNYLIKQIDDNNLGSIELNVSLIEKSNQIDEVEVIGSKVSTTNVNKLNAEEATVISTAGDGIVSLLKSLPGVASNNELSSQYMVRGGNFDENLIYVNGMEVYRPFLIRSGQQEGLSFANSSMVKNIEFYAGGFESKYGDKMSSVLNIEYREPKEFQALFEASLLGASATVDLVSKDKKWSSIIGMRYKNISLITKTQDTEANFTPIYTDIQSVVYYRPNEKFKLSFLSNLSLNQYNYTPVSRKTNFGTINQPLQLIVFYDGNEQDNYLTWSLNANAEYIFNESTISKFYVSSFQTQESEYYDILGQYRLSELNGSIGDDDFGNPINTIGIGTQLEHARNEFDALVINIGTSTKHILSDDRKLEWGFRYSREDIYDRLNEWEYVDSSGFSLPHNNNFEPQEPYNGPLEVYHSASANNSLNSHRAEVFTQYEQKFEINDITISYNVGIRANYWTVNNQLSVSPRGIVNFHNQNNPNMLYWVSVGKYSQAPFYRELRTFDGSLNKDVKAQDSWHFVLGANYNFYAWNRPFKWTSELYYKKMTNLNPYIVDNVRLRYYGNNSGVGYVAGADFRINGEFVPGVESWMSMGIMKAEQSIDNQGYIPLPTDQRFKFAMFFQDYLPKFPTFKVNLNLVYSTGLPGGGPSYGDPYEYQIRLPDYKRLDIGFTKIFSDHAHDITSSWMPDVKYASLSLEILNVADIKNTISYSWVRDVYSKGMYAVPNKLTGIFWNVKLQVRI